MVCNKQFNTLGHCEIWSHFTRTLYFHLPSARDILSLLMKYLVVFHADPCNKSYIYNLVVGDMIGHLDGPYSHRTMETGLYI